MAYQDLDLQYLRVLPVIVYSSVSFFGNKWPLHFLIGIDILEFACWTNKIASRFSTFLTHKHWVECFCWISCEVSFCQFNDNSKYCDCRAEPEDSDSKLKLPALWSRADSGVFFGIDVFTCYVWVLHLWCKCIVAGIL